MAPLRGGFNEDDQTRLSRASRTRRFKSVGV
jgi:hypothetical protein